ncbi:TBC1 domain family member 9B [Eurytemora carolleeae]|uniref:TBC1 domain family member 9B n=1 Tax=Eurytemora carolleeae TaxID=1294199 RepID=UPI000C793A6F|nr:TBC1 domain family member 9B [Eurytemora carolleeae]|eukprot:XP_023334555.1 TBC1 domain family member 9B-like [Eurytemora affinis]
MQERLDPNLPYYALYKLDYDTFHQIFELCSPWRKAEVADQLSLRMFKIMDPTRNEFINFKDVVILLSMMCGEDLQKKLKLLYCLHLPGVVHPSELEQEEREGAEVASDATDYFTEDDLEIGKTVQFIREQSQEANLGQEEDVISSIQDWLVRQCSKLEMKKIPPLPQKYFVLLWKTLYALFMEPDLSAPSTEEQQKLYHSVSVVGTLLLQIGEVGERLDRKSAERKLLLESEPHITEGTPELAEDASGEAATVKESGAASSPATSSEAVDENKNSAGAVWNISFEQFLASILTESVLVDHFSKGVDIQAPLTEFSCHGWRKAADPLQLAGHPVANSVFYV